jgi:alkylation response protein AidB-like acyl-CoA dehydrogenase
MIFSEKHELVRKLARDFAEKELTKDILDQIEETGEYPKELLDKMANAGFFGIKTPVKYGGQGSDYLSYVITLEELGRVSAVTDIWVSAPNSLGGGPLLLAGTEEQLQKYLVPIAKGEKIMAFGLTEPNAGSDAGATATTAVRDGDYWVLNGRKTFITTAPVADWTIIYARTDRSQKGSRGISAFIMDMKLPGVSLGKNEHKMGIIGCPTSDIIMEDVRVHKDDMLGEEG